MALNNSTFTALTSGTRDNTQDEKGAVYFLDGNTTNGRLNISSGAIWKTGANTHIVYDGNDLFLNFENAPLLTARLQHWHYNTWEIKWDNVHAWFDFGTVKFNLNATMNVTGFDFDVPNYDIFFHELEVKKIN